MPFYPAAAKTNASDGLLAGTVKKTAMVFSLAYATGCIEDRLELNFLRTSLGFGRDTEVPLV